MRPIKFRAWDKIGKRMLMNIEAGKLDKAYSEFSELSLKSILDFPDFEVMQFTGLYDKNGKEIYEGDIVQAKITNEDVIPATMQKEIVEFQAERNCGFYPFLGQSDCCGCSPQMKFEKCEIVGNIYENPELLEISK